MGLMIFAFVVLVGLVVLAVYVFIELAKWPGKEARKRGNPHADGIAALSWGGLLMTFGIAWLVALAWAKSTPMPADDGAAAEA